MLVTLYLNNNQLTGPVPDLSALTNLENLDLADNQLCLPDGVSLSHPNSEVDAHLKGLNLAACSDS